MGRHKITGKEKCPFVYKSGNLCAKLGRYSSEIIASDTKQKFAKKFTYKQFIHNDASKKHYIPINNYNSDKYKGHVFEGSLHMMADFATLCEREARSLRKMAERLIKPYDDKFTKKEKEVVQNYVTLKNEEMTSRFRYAFLTKTVHTDFIMKDKTPPDHIMLELDNELQKLQETTILTRNALLPLIHLYIKYDFPRRRKKWQLSYEKQRNWPYGTTHIRKGIMG